MDFRPLGWLAAASFAIGFAGYLAVATPRESATEVVAPTVQTSGPASDAWNFEKKI